MAAPSFGQLDVFEPAIGWRFSTTLPAITNTGQVTTSNTSNIDVASGLLVQSYSVVHKTLDSETAAFQAGIRHYPIGTTIDMITAHFIETSSLDVIQYFNNWRNLIIDDDGNFGLPKDYFKTIRFDPYDVQGESSLSFIYDETWPLRVDPYQYDSSAHNNIVASVTFVCSKHNIPTRS